MKKRIIFSILFFILCQILISAQNKKKYILIDFDSPVSLIDTFLDNEHLKKDKSAKTVFKEVVANCKAANKSISIYNIFLTGAEDIDIFFQYEVKNIKNMPTSFLNSGGFMTALTVLPDSKFTYLKDMEKEEKLSIYTYSDIIKECIKRIYLVGTDFYDDRKGENEYYQNFSFLKSNEFGFICKKDNIIKVYEPNCILVEFYRLHNELCFYPTENDGYTINLWTKVYTQDDLKKEDKNLKSYFEATYKNNVDNIINSKFSNKIYLKNKQNGVYTFFQNIKNRIEIISPVPKFKNNFDKGIEEFRYHPDIGIIGGTYKTIMERLGIDTGGKMFELKTVNDMSMEEYLKTIKRN